MDPIDRAKEAAAMIDASRKVMAEERVARRDALTQARETMSAAEIAEQLGISTARVYRILSGKET